MYCIVTSFLKSSRDQIKLKYFVTVIKLILLYTQNYQCDMAYCVNMNNGNDQLQIDSLLFISANEIFLQSWLTPVKAKNY